MYHPLTPGQSWAQSPVSFRRKMGEGRGERGDSGQIEGTLLSGMDNDFQATVKRRGRKIK